MRLLPLAIVLGCAGVASGLTAGTAYAHGFGERYDLPLPLNLFVVGGAATVLASFVVLSLFMRGGSGRVSYPRLDLLRVPLVGPVLSSRALIAVLRSLGVVVLLLLAAAGFIGSNRPLDNISPTFVWIIFWVGMGYVAALLGNLWAVVNPWKTVFEWAERIAGAPSGPMYLYPQGWDRWPAAVLFLVFVWLENVYPSAAAPLNLAILIVLYSLVTWAGMVLFGKHVWLHNGELFSVLFAFFARFSPTEMRVPESRVCRSSSSGCEPYDGDCVDSLECFEVAGGTGAEREVNLRPYAVGLTLPGRLSTSGAAFVMLMLASVTFDGLSETQLWRSVQNALYSTASALGTDPLGVIDTVGVLAVVAGFAAVYLAFSWGIRQFSGDDLGVVAIARVFVLSLVPIALAYNLAHFIGYLLIQGQLIIPLASDPFGWGWNLLGTAGYRLDLEIIGAQAVWYISVAAIVLGHVASVYVAHVVSLGRPVGRAAALRGQYAMLALMVVYTASSLWIIAQPIVEQ